MAIAAPSDEVTRLVEALGLRTKNTREVTLRMAVNEVVAVNTVEYVNAEQAGTLAAELKERQYRLVRWVSVEERLPADRVWVLVSWGTQGELVIAHWRADEQEWLDDQGKVVPAVGVTHWMKLPEPPELKR